MDATGDDDRASAGGRDVVDQLRSAGALDGLFEQTWCRAGMTGADGLLPALHQGRPWRGSWPKDELGLVQGVQRLGQGLSVADGPVLHAAVASDAPGQRDQPPVRFRCQTAISRASRTRSVYRLVEVSTIRRENTSAGKGDVDPPQKGAHIGGASPACGGMLATHSPSRGEGLEVASNQVGRSSTTPETPSRPT